MNTANMFLQSSVRFLWDQEYQHPEARSSSSSLDSASRHAQLVLVFPEPPCEAPQLFFSTTTSHLRLIGFTSITASTNQLAAACLPVTSQSSSALKVHDSCLINFLLPVLLLKAEQKRLIHSSNVSQTSAFLSKTPGGRFYVPSRQKYGRVVISLCLSCSCDPSEGFSLRPRLQIHFNNGSESE
ncbi:hypothetical protein CHARACLAT_026900 [Characodon lateralis]|uniref:Uncharacterized protein n=1 Tax=Characodon lateralis TaxID=208331 RepID=A0ABU7ED55_9TELE|nr:hypothetical protein [Characodon lateralis]